VLPRVDGYRSLGFGNPNTHNPSLSEILHSIPMVLVPRPIPDSTADVPR
jgi:hypothetical protein